MSKTHDNRKLYEKILSSTSQEELEPIKILNNGYPCKYGNLNAYKIYYGTIPVTGIYYGSIQIQ